MRLFWSRRAIDDLRAIEAFIEKNNPTAARTVSLRLIDAVETVIATNPNVGRPGRVPGTRELVVARTSYIVPYRLHSGVIEVLRIYHGARRWPGRL
ncbi:MAG TPA: type II toxin-antitoxin system RelE/ParE family toxin [Roseiarcus sp.]